MTLFFIGAALALLAVIGIAASPYVRHSYMGESLTEYCARAGGNMRLYGVVIGFAGLGLAVGFFLMVTGFLVGFVSFIG